MADDGMLVNFEIPTLPAKPAVKFQGGTWRDRARAQKSLRSGPPKRKEPPTDKTTLLPNLDLPESNRPARKARLDNWSGNSNISNKMNGLGLPGKKATPGKHVTSSLFSSNPKHRTDFDEVVEQAEAEKEKGLAAPTNAPLMGPQASFAALGLSERVVRELGKMELSHPTAIQKKTIPLMLETEDDAFLQAQTGSGKTLAYLLPMVHRVLELSKTNQIHRDSGIFGIVLTPTRELAKQTHTVLMQLLRATPWLVASAILGGEKKKSEKERLRKGINFLVATPGRLSDHLTNTQVLKLSTVRWLVLDEGDRLMDMGFEEDVKKIVGMLKKAEVAFKTYNNVPMDVLPKRRVTILCSATLKMTVQRLGEMSLNDAVQIAVTPEDLDAERAEREAEKKKEVTKEEGQEETTVVDGAIDTEANDAQQEGHLIVGGKTYMAPAQLKQTYLIVPAKLRLVTLLAYLKNMFSRRDSIMKAILFISCADSVDFHYDLLKKPSSLAPGVPVEENKTSETVSPAAYITSAANPNISLYRLHGSLAQAIRTATLQSFAFCKEPALLVTTDVAARGLDIPDVDLVIELDPAFSIEDHIHRIGRTARAGRAGRATLFLQPGCEEGYVSLLKASGSPQPMLYDTVLRSAMMLPWELPVETHATMLTEKTSYTRQAENLQLHLEQRLLDPANHTQLELGRQAFRSHIRAYATHIKEERVYFDITNLHLGHMAKAFGLRDAPSGIGAGIERKASKAAKAAKAGKTGPKRGGSTGGGVGAKVAVMKAAGGEDDAETETIAAAKRMLRMKSKMMMNTASEFNIG